MASPKIEQEIVEEFIAFVQKTPNLLGIDSFLVIVLPKHLAINYMLNFCPEYLWQYGKVSLVILDIIFLTFSNYLNL